jgi:WD40 repeat protein
MRNRSIQSTIQAHDLNVKALLIDEPSGCLISGSTDGDIKFWSMDTFEYVDIWRGVHEKNWFLRATLDRTPVSTYGVMGLEANGEWIYSCGADGAVKRCKRPVAFPEEAGGSDINIVHL